MWQILCEKEDKKNNLMKSQWDSLKYTYSGFCINNGPHKLKCVMSLQFYIYLSISCIIIDYIYIENFSLSTDIYI